jgi:hypothetical protein
LMTMRMTLPDAQTRAAMAGHRHGTWNGSELCPAGSNDLASSLVLIHQRSGRAASPMLSRGPLARRTLVANGIRSKVSTPAHLAAGSALAPLVQRR